MKKIFFFFNFIIITILSNAQAPTFQWAKHFGANSTYTNCYSAAVDSSGNIYTVGTYSSSTVDFDPGSGTYFLPLAGSTDIFVSKLDSLGNFLWAKGMGGTVEDIVYSVSTDKFGNVYTIGKFRGTADFDPGPSVYNLTAASDYGVFVS